MATLVDGIDYELKQTESKMANLKKDIEKRHIELNDCQVKIKQLKRAKMILLGEPQKALPPKREPKEVKKEPEKEPEQQQENA